LNSEPSRIPPWTSKIRSWIDMSITISETPVYCTGPAIVTSFVPVECSGPIAWNQAPPRMMMSGAFASVSTLLTTVGLPHSPYSTERGGLVRGCGRSPCTE
jgi:hypothetical protein